MRIMTFTEALVDAAVHGELTEAQARDWLSGDDLAAALRVIRNPPHLVRAGEGGQTAGDEPDS